MSRNYSFGPEPRTRMHLTPEQALEHARTLEGSGYIWRLHSTHWAIVANYANGEVFNGMSQIVPATPDTI